jgi:hypothetical protein
MDVWLLFLVGLMGVVGWLFMMILMGGVGFRVGGGFVGVEEGGLVEDVLVGGELEVGL